MGVDIESKEFIDGASYKTLLRQWRHHPPEDLIFLGDNYLYYSKVIREKRKALAELVACQIERDVDLELSRAYGKEYRPVIPQNRG